jgi:hypothetical protein
MTGPSIHTIPHFRVSGAGGETVDYAKDIWQRRNLVLVALPAGAEARAAADAYAPVAAEDARLVVTSDPVAGVEPPAVLIADQWGEVAHVFTPPGIEDLPPVSEVASWVDHVRQRCPECEGEAR